MHSLQFETLFISLFVYFPLQVKELKEKMLSSGMPWPGDESDHRWEQAWMAIKKVCSPDTHTSEGSRLHISRGFDVIRNAMDLPT